MAGDGAGEVEAGKGWKEVEDKKLKVRAGGLKGVVEPTAERVVAGAGGRGEEKVGDLGSNVVVVEEGEGRVVREGDGIRERAAKDLGKRLEY